MFNLCSISQLEVQCQHGGPSGGLLEFRLVLLGKKSWQQTCFVTAHAMFLPQLLLLTNSLMFFDTVDVCVLAWLIDDEDEMCQIL